MVVPAVSSTTDDHAEVTVHELVIEQPELEVLQLPSALTVQRPHTDTALVWVRIEVYQLARVGSHAHSELQELLGARGLTHAILHGPLDKVVHFLRNFLHTFEAPRHIVHNIFIRSTVLFHSLIQHLE